MIIPISEFLLQKLRDLKAAKANNAQFEAARDTASCTQSVALTEEGCQQVWGPSYADGSKEAAYILFPHLRVKIELLVTRHQAPFMNCDMGMVYQITTCGKLYRSQTGHFTNDRAR